MATIRLGIDVEWPAARVLESMALHQRRTSQESHKRDDFITFLGSSSLSSSVGLLRKDLLQSIEELHATCASPAATNPAEICDSVPTFPHFEWEKIELEMLQNLLHRLQETEAFTKKEIEELERFQPPSLQQRDAMKVAELEYLVRSERAQRDLAVARAQHQEALCELERAAPFNVLNALALTSMVPFSIESLSPTRVEVSFMCVVEGPHPWLQWDAVDGIACYINPQASPIREGKQLIPADHAATTFFQSMLFSNSGLEIRPSIEQYAMSNDLQESVFGLSHVLGRLDLAILDLTRVIAKPHVHGVSVERKDQSSSVHLSISLDENLDVTFFYDRACQEGIAHSTPSQVSVMQGGVRMESLEAVAAQTMDAASILSSASCLERICDAVFSASYT